MTHAAHDVYSTTFSQMQGQQPGHADPLLAFHLSEYFLLCIFNSRSSELQMPALSISGAYMLKQKQS